MTTATECRNCHSTDVTWRKSRAGRWVLMNTTGNRYDRVYLRGPHYQTCSARQVQPMPRALASRS